MKVRIINVDRSLFSLPDDQHSAWDTWLAQHGLNGRLIPLNTLIIIDDDARSITARYYKLDDTGRVIVKDLDPVYETVVRALESPALPCPTGLIHVTEAEA